MALDASEILEITNMKILIADDNNKNLQLIGNILRDMNYKILLATDGKMALEIVEKTIPDIILLDVMMPEFDGFEVCRKLKGQERTRDIPVIFLTSLKDTDNILEGFEAGGVDYVTKPFKKEELLARINTHIELKLAKDIILRQNKQLKALNSTKEVQNRQLKELNGAKDKFFSIIAHDLRSPIMGFINLSELMSGDVGRFSVTEIQKMSVQLHNSSIELFKLLENLLQWSRSQTGRIEFQPEEHDFTYLVEQNIKIARELAETKNIEIINELPDMLTLFFDYNMLGTVVRNLLSNAVKFTRGGGKIKIYSVDSGSRVEIKISDTGIGISREDIAKLCKIDCSYRTIGTLGELGSGLGLMICKEFVEWHGSNLNIESEVGQGSTFSFILTKKQFED